MRDKFVAERIGHVDLPAGVVQALHQALPRVAEETVAALTREVAEYSESALGEPMVSTIEDAVGVALGTFLRVTTDDEAQRPGLLAPALEAAYALGRGEARAGRTMEALLAAYRVGARVAWQAQSSLLVERDVGAATIALYAQLVFTYIDELSSSSAAGHRDELVTSGRLREQLLEHLAVAMLSGAPADQLAIRAERAGWATPETVTVVIVASAHLSNAAHLLDPRSLRLAGDLAPDLPADDLAVLIVPDVRNRSSLAAALVGRSAVIGPPRPWTDAHVSYRRAVRTLELVPNADAAALDTEQHLLAVVLSADPAALADLRERALRPLDGLRRPAAERLVETLNSWLLHQGRREEVAAHLHVHPQTVRYRMNQLRALLGDQLNDPAATLELIIATSSLARGGTGTG